MIPFHPWHHFVLPCFIFLVSVFATPPPPTRLVATGAVVASVVDSVANTIKTRRVLGVRSPPHF